MLFGRNGLAIGLLIVPLLLDCSQPSKNLTEVDGGQPLVIGTDAGATDGGTVDGGTADDWFFYRHDVLGQSNVDIPFTDAQAASLKNVWTYQHAEASYSNPIVVDGVIYQAWADGTLKAIDRATGTEQWVEHIGIVAPSGCVMSWAAPIGAAAVVGGTVFAAGGDGAVYALDRTTGQQLWKTPVADNSQNEFLWTSIFPLHGKVYVGVGVLDEDKCMIPVEGRVVALDQTSGQIVATWWVTGQMPGGGVWTQPVFDAATNRLFYATGNSVASAGPEPQAQAIVAIDADTLQLEDSYQLVTSNNTDDDFGASPTLYDLPDGRHMIAVINKNCVVAALDRNHLAQGPVWTVPLCVGGTSPDEGTGSIVSPTFAHGRLYVAGGATTDGFPGIIAALDPATGSYLWKVHPDGFVLPALLTVGDVLVAGASHLADTTGRLYVLDQSTGTTLMTYPTPGELFAPPSFAEGTLLVPDTTGHLYAFQASP